MAFETKIKMKIFNCFETIYNQACLKFTTYNNPLYDHIEDL